MMMVEKREGVGKNWGVDDLYMFGRQISTNKLHWEIQCSVKFCKVSWLHFLLHFYYAFWYTFWYTLGTLLLHIDYTLWYTFGTLLLHFYYAFWYTLTTFLFLHFKYTLVIKMCHIYYTFDDSFRLFRSKNTF